MRKLLIPLFLMLLVSFLIFLGFWQLHRAHEKREILNQQALGQTQVPIRLKDIQKIDASLAFRKIQLTGHFDNQRSFLLDNKFSHHRLGYQVLTPFQDHKTKQWVLINRGWIPQSQDRTEKPKIPAVSGNVTILGIIHTAADRGFVLGKAIEDARIWPVLLQRIQYDTIARLLGVSVVPFVVLLDPKEPFGFDREWQLVTIDPQRHIGYAVQWFLLAATLIVGLIIYQVKNRKGKNVNV